MFIIKRYFTISLSYHRSEHASINDHHDVSISQILHFFFFFFIFSIILQGTRRNDKTFIFEQECYYCGDKYSQVDAYVISDFHTFAPCLYEKRGSSIKVVRKKNRENNFLLFFCHDDYM